MTTGSLQSGPDIGPTFAGDMIVQDGQVYLTGITYGQFGTSLKDPSTAHCFLGVSTTLDLASWQSQSTFGSDDVDSTCTDLAIFDETLFVIGSTEEGGLLTNL